MVQMYVKDDWRFVSMECGVVFVMTLGMTLMLELCVHRLDIQDKVCDASLLLLFKCSDSYSSFNLLTGSVSRRGAYFEESSYGPVSISNIQCTGSESRLQDCSLSQSPSSACTHSQDAGVTCVGK